MLKKILSISGKPGLFKLISQGRNSVIVESLINARRMPAHATDRIVSLADISIYTNEEDKPLVEVLELLRQHTDGKTVDVKAFKTSDELKEYMGEFLPDFDRERVYPSDIKKLLQWYNILIEAGFDKFEEEKDDEAEATGAAQTDH